MSFILNSFNLFMFHIYKRYSCTKGGTAMINYIDYDPIIYGIGASSMQVIITMVILAGTQ